MVPLLFLGYINAVRRVLGHYDEGAEVLLAGGGHGGCETSFGLRFLPRRRGLDIDSRRTRDTSSGLAPVPSITTLASGRPPGFRAASGAPRNPRDARRSGVVEDRYCWSEFRP